MQVELVSEEYFWNRQEQIVHGYAAVAVNGSGGSQAEDAFD